MLDLLKLKASVERAISELAELKKIQAIYYEYEYPTLSFHLVVSEKLMDDEVEEARVAQTEVLSDFPDREIDVFIINQYLMSNDEGTVSKIKGELIYKSNKMIEEVKGYKLIDTEKAEA